jgi:hypothetical protein
MKAITGNRHSKLAVLSGFVNLIRLIYLISLLLPLTAFGQKQKDVNIILECVEYIGNGKYIANFGYDNPNNFNIVVPETNSILIYNNGQTKVKTINTFIAGRIW